MSIKSTLVIPGITTASGSAAEIAQLQQEVAQIEVDLAGKATKATDFKTPLTSENLGATMTDLMEVKTSSITFIGYVSTTEPSSSTLTLNHGNLWYNSATMPTTFPIDKTELKQWNGSAWVDAQHNYSPDDLDAWKNLDDTETYVWFAGEWEDYAPQLSSEYFTLNGATGKWEIKSSVNLAGYPTVTNEPTTAMGIANKDYVDAIAGDFKRAIYDIGAVVNYASSTTVELASNTSAYTIKPTGSLTLTFSTNNLTIPTNALTTFYLILDMSDGVQTVTWPTNVQWGNISPSMNANLCYMFSFTKPYNANVWIGNQMYSWEAQ